MDGGSGVLLHGEETEAVELALVAAGSTWGAGGGSHPHPALSLKGEGQNGAPMSGIYRSVGGVGRGVRGRPLTGFGRRRRNLPLPLERD